MWRHFPCRYSPDRLVRLLFVVCCLLFAGVGGSVPGDTAANDSRRVVSRVLTAASVRTADLADQACSESRCILV